MATRVMKVQDTFLWLTLNNPKFQGRWTAYIDRLGRTTWRSRQWRYQ